MNSVRISLAACREKLVLLLQWNDHLPRRIQRAEQTRRAFAVAQSASPSLCLSDIGCSTGWYFASSKIPLYLTFRCVPDPHSYMAGTTGSSSHRVVHRGDRYSVLSFKAASFRPAQRGCLVVDQEVVEVERCFKVVLCGTWKACGDASIEVRQDQGPVCVHSTNCKLIAASYVRYTRKGEGKAKHTKTARPINDLFA